MDTHLVFQRLFRWSAIPAKEVADAAVHLRDLAMRVWGDADVTFGADENSMH